MIVCGTGHRPDKIEGGYWNYLQHTMPLIQLWLLNNKVDRIITGMAQGWDTALALVAIDYKIPFTAAVPFIGQELKWPKKAQIQYQEILDKAEKVVVVSTGGYAAYKMQIRNEYMVGNSDLVLAYWNGSGGGTANCIRYAESKKKTVVNLYDR